MATYLLVDAENRKVDLTAIPDHVTVPYFHGAGQKTVTREFHLAALKLGARYVPIEVNGQANDALDLHLAFFLGQLLDREPDAEVIILSGDRGFEILVAHLRKLGRNVRQAGSLAAAFAVPRESDEGADARYARVLKLLPKVEAKHRPRKRKSLAAHLGNYWTGVQKATPADVERLIDRLIADGHLVERDGAVTYRF